MKVDFRASADPPNLTGQLEVATEDFNKIFDTIEDPAEYKLFYQIFYPNRKQPMTNKEKLEILLELDRLMNLHAVTLQPGMGPEVLDPAAPNKRRT